MPELPENLQWSIPVPSVKELAKERLDYVPERYIRNDGIYPVAPSDASIYVPLIDMSKLVSPEHHEIELQKLHAACRDWGAFQLVNHGVSGELTESMKKKAEEFFALPLQEKERWAHKPGSLEGYGQAFVLSEGQKLDWCDMIFLRTLPADIRNLKFWPTTPYQYRETLETYSQEIKELAVSLFGFIVMALGLQGRELSKAFQDGRYEVKMNCYPPCPEPERVVGGSSHTDICAITFLLCSDVLGLQVLKDGQWVWVKPMAGTFIVNVGNILEIMSNGIYKAPFHRAMVNKCKERLSIATFCYPSSNVKIEPAKELVKAGSSPLYKSLSMQEYFQNFFDWKLAPTPFIDTLKL